jgi:hypothetical protein
MNKTIFLMISIFPKLILSGKGKKAIVMLWAFRLPLLATILLSPLQTSVAETTDDWYVFKPTNTANPGVIGMADWLEKPAGKHGRIKSLNDKLIYNGEPIKLWGLNNTYSACAPKKEMADKRAAFYAKYGLNSVRLHKYADGPGWAGIQSKTSFVNFDPEGLNRMDYYVANLIEQGIYVKLSSTFGVKLGIDDKKAVPFMDEFGEMRGNRVQTRHGSIFLSEELQDLQIQQIVNILNHENPYTKKRYADEPGIVVVELFNEDSALWFGIMQQLERVPTLKKRAAEMFCEWLRAKYQTHDALEQAWGKEAFNWFKKRGISKRTLGSKQYRTRGQSLVLRSQTTGRNASSCKKPFSRYHAILVRTSKQIL